MVIYLGADHRGFSLKESIKSFLKDQGYEVYDLGAAEYSEGDDYPDFAAAVAGKVGGDPDRSRGILLCGSGVGVDVVANKFRRVRSALGFAADQAFDARHDEDANVLSIAADFTNEIEAKKMVKIFLDTPFGGDERFRRRLDKIANLENV